jgi:hypothetical protein
MNESHVWRVVTLPVLAVKVENKGGAQRRACRKKKPAKNEPAQVGKP